MPIIPSCDYYIVSVDWGDGSFSSWPPQGWGFDRPPGEPATLRHAYHDLGLYFVTVRVRYVWYDGQEYNEEHVYRSFMVNVTAPWYEYAGAVKSFVSGLEEEGNFVEKGVH